MKNLFLVTALLLAPLGTSESAPADTVATVARPDTTRTNQFYIGNRKGVSPGYLH